MQQAAYLDMNKMKTDLIIRKISKIISTEKFNTEVCPYYYLSRNVNYHDAHSFPSHYNQVSQTSQTEPKLCISLMLNCVWTYLVE